MEEIKRLREMMKSYTAADEDFDSDMNHGIKKPSLAKYHEGSKRIHLPKNFEKILQNNNFYQLLTERKSCRKYSYDTISLQELSYLLYATQGVKKVIKDQTATLRNVPSGGAIHPFETYIYANNVSGLEEGLYHYLPIEHELEKLIIADSFKKTISEAFLGQTFLTEAPVSFYWSILPYRCEWKYASKAHRVALMDLGCICQTLYLAAESIACGTCMVGAYDQEMADTLFGFDTTPGDNKDVEFLLGGAGVGLQ